MYRNLTAIDLSIIKVGLDMIKMFLLHYIYFLGLRMATQPGFPGQQPMPPNMRPGQPGPNQVTILVPLI